MFVSHFYQHIDNAKKSLDSGRDEVAENLVSIAYKNLGILNSKTAIELKKQLDKIIKEIKKFRQNKPNIKIGIASDSLSLPRPYYMKDFDHINNPSFAYNYEDTYPELLRKQLSNKYEQEIIVNNFANRSTGINFALYKQNDMHHWYGLDVSIFHFGIVDCWLRTETGMKPQISPEVFEQKFKQFADFKNNLAPAANSIVIGIAPTTAHRLQKVPEQNKLINQYNNILKSNLPDNTLFLDIEALYQTCGDALLHKDGNHLSELGNKIFADELNAMIQKTLKQRISRLKSSKIKSDKLTIGSKIKPIDNPNIFGYIQKPSIKGNILTQQGWAIDKLSKSPATKILIAKRDKTIIGIFSTCISRNDIATKFGKSFLKSGFKIKTSNNNEILNTNDYDIYASDKDGLCGKLIKCK